MRPAATPPTRSRRGVRVALCAVAAATFGAALAGCAAKPLPPPATTVTIPYRAPPRNAAPAATVPTATRPPDATAPTAARPPTTTTPTATRPPAANPATATRPPAANPTAPTTVPPARPGDLAAQAAAVAHFARNGQPIYCGRGDRRLVALTFDDGPGPDTATVLRELLRAGAPATFFLVGRNVLQFPHAPQRERAVGAIGDHTMTHPSLTSLTHAAARAEIEAGRSAALRAAGHPVSLFRPPYEAHDRWIDHEIAREGMAQILWDVDSTDTGFPPTDFHEIYHHVRRYARPGSIILMHENRPQTVRALHAILPMLRRRHLRPVTVPQLLAADPPTTAQVDAGFEGCQPGWHPSRARHVRARRRTIGHE